jgi:hypothetical protein
MVDALTIGVQDASQYAHEYGGKNTRPDVLLVLVLLNAESVTLSPLLKLRVVSVQGYGGFVVLAEFQGLSSFVCCLKGEADYLLHFLPVALIGDNRRFLVPAFPAGIPGIIAAFTGVGGGIT